MAAPWRGKANAIDRSPVLLPTNEQKSMSKERTFTEDTLDLRYMRNLLLDMTDKLAFELRNDKSLPPASPSKSGTRRF